MPDPFDNLLARARAGEREALEQLFTRLEPRVLAIVRKRLGDALRGDFDSADIQQSVLKDAYRDLARAHASDEDALLGWIAGLVEHKLANKARDRKRLKRDAGELARLDATATDGSPAPEPAAALDSPSVDATLREELDQLRSALERLPPRWREVFVQRAVQRLEWSEIAQRTGQTVKAAQSCFDRARIRLAVERAQ
jgi:RNA polymerase sigma factor (sigma-70 family)